MNFQDMFRHIYVQNFKLCGLKLSVGTFTTGYISFTVHLVVDSRHSENASLWMSSIHLWNKFSHTFFIFNVVFSL